jgi:hypothetical protein
MELVQWQQNLVGDSILKSYLVTQIAYCSKPEYYLTNCQNQF